MFQTEKKYIKQLQQKKYRKHFQEFVVEGLKSIKDFLEAGFELVKVYSTVEIAGIKLSSSKLEKIDKKKLYQISYLKNPKDALAIFKIPSNQNIPKSGWVIALDNLQDPGNLGTIIRTADWFGIQNIVCSPKTVDAYNPKVVQATMGSLANVQVQYIDLLDFFSNTNLTIYGACMQGENIYQIDFPSEGIILIGNEGNGISENMQKIIKNKIHIPKYKNSTAESLNAAIATAIFINEIKK